MTPTTPESNEPISNEDMASAIVYGDSLVRAFHVAYEDLAPDFGYETKLETRVPFDELPEGNKKLMLAVGMRIWHNEIAPRFDRLKAQADFANDCLNREDVRRSVIERERDAWMYALVAVVGEQVAHMKFRDALAMMPK